MQVLSDASTHIAAWGVTCNEGRQEVDNMATLNKQVAGMVTALDQQVCMCVWTSRYVCVYGPAGMYACIVYVCPHKRIYIHMCVCER